MTLPVELSKSLRRRALQPPGLPEGNPAWSQDDARLVLEALEGSITAVFQVDAYVVPFGHHEVIHTGRRATYGYNVGELALHFAARSRRLAQEFIAVGSSDQLFVLLFSEQDDAEAGHGNFRIRAG
jgi:hypothetical protein